MRYNISLNTKAAHALAQITEAWQVTSSEAITLLLTDHYLKHFENNEPDPVATLLFDFRKLGPEKKAKAPATKQETTLKTFINECCLVNSQEDIRSSILYEAYREWTFLNSYRPLSTRAFKREIESLGYRHWHKTSGNFYKGIALKE